MQDSAPGRVLPSAQSGDPIAKLVANAVFSNQDCISPEELRNFTSEKLQI